MPPVNPFVFLNTETGSVLQKLSADGGATSKKINFQLADK